MYHPTTRVLTVLELLQTHAQMSGPDLARRLEVSTRSVRKYILMLQDLGIPVESEPGKYGGYRLRPGYKLPPLMFTDDEAVALVVGLRAVRHAGLSVASPDVEGALAKLERVLPETVSKRVRGLAAVVFDLEAPRSQSEALVVAALSEAVHTSTRVWLRYSSWEGDETERKLDPYGVVCQKGRWYVIGFDHLRTELRTFRIDRIRAARPCDEHFEHPNDFDALAYLQRAIALAPIGWSVEALLETTLEQARQYMPPIMATLEEVPNGVLLRHQVYHQLGLEPLARSLLDFRCPIVVITPDELRDAFRRLAARASKAALRP